MLHPVLRQEYAVFTPPIEEMARCIGDWIDGMAPGGYVYGPSRFGKSRGIKFFLRSLLQERYGTDVPLIIWSRMDGICRSQPEFWKELLQASNFVFADRMVRRNFTELRRTFIHRCTTLANESLGNQIILLIDEAQDLTHQELTWLLGLHNSLDQAGYRLTLISVGSHQMRYQYDYLARAGSAHIAARFFAVHKRFSGLTEVDQLAFALDGYDEASEWPKSSGISYLRYFAPDEFEQGRRLAHCAEDIWHVLRKIAGPAPKKLSDEFPMQHVARATEGALIQLSKGGRWQDITSPAAWEARLVATGLADHMRIVRTSE